MKNGKYYVVQGKDRAGIYQSLTDALYQVRQYPFSKLLEFTVDCCKECYIFCKVQMNLLLKQSYIFLM